MSKILNYKICFNVYYIKYFQMKLHIKHKKMTKI